MKTLHQSLTELAEARSELGKALRETSAYRAMDCFVHWLNDRLTR